MNLHGHFNSNGCTKANFDTICEKNKAQSDGGTLGTFSQKMSLNMDDVIC
jgi:hypothetical protein